MKYISLIIFAICTLTTYGQSKYDYVNFNKLTEIQGTEYVIASIESWDKMKRLKNNYLLFIDTKTGQTNRVEFPNKGYFDEFKQVKIDSLGINKIIVSAQTIDSDGKKGINWKDPLQIFVLSTDGKDITQLTDDNLFAGNWIINKQSGAIIIKGHYDSNNNGKYDKKDKNEIGIYDLKTLKLIGKI